MENLEAQTILDVVPPRGRNGWPIQYHRPEVEHFGPPAATTTATPKLPFQIYASADENGNLTLNAAPGTVGGYSGGANTYATITETNPADGAWFLEASASINAASGSFTGSSVEFVRNESSSTATTAYRTIGFCYVEDGIPGGFEQYDYGPLISISHGGLEDKWNVILI